MCVEGMAGNTDGEGGREQMTGVLNPSRVWILFGGKGKPLGGSKQGCSVVRQVLQKAVSDS